MFFLILMLLALVVAGLARWRHSYVGGEWIITSITSFVFATLFFIISITSFLCSYSTQIEAFEELKRVDAVSVIYQTKATLLTNHFAQILIEKYPHHEKDIFKLISPDKIDVYLAKYPELSASKTAIILVEKINKMQSDYYKQQIYKEKILKEIRFRTKDPWLLYWFIPEIN